MQSHSSTARRDGGHGLARFRMTAFAGAAIALISMSSAIADPPAAASDSAPTAAVSTTKPVDAPVTKPKTTDPVKRDAPDTNCAAALPASFDDVRKCLGAGIAIGGFFFTEPDVISTALDPGTNIVRVTEEHQREASFWLEVHATVVPLGKLFDSDDKFGLNSMTFGPFAAIQLGGTNGTLNSLAVGGMFFFPLKIGSENSDGTKDLSSHIAGLGLGLGYGWTQIHTLGDGIIEDHALPAGLNAVPMKQSDIGGIVVMLSTTVAL